jgi:hypothetical protein
VLSSPVTSRARILAQIMLVMKKIQIPFFRILVMSGCCLLSTQRIVVGYMFRFNAEPAG